MSKEINSIDDLKKTTVEEVNEDVVEETAEDNNPYLQAAIERSEEAQKKAKEEEQEEIERKRREDGRQYEFEVNGFNIGDSLMRRANAINDNGQALSNQLQEEDMEREISDDDLLNAEPDSLESEIDSALKDTSSDDDIEDIENDDSDLPTSPSDLNIDYDDLLDLELDDLDATDSSNDDDDISEKEMEGLRNQIKEKLSVSAPVNKDGTISISQKAVSLTEVLNQQKSNAVVVDFPLMSAGRCVSMREFSGTEIESLNRGASGRNRFNTMKDIYHTLYDHIVDPNKPDFDQWLKVTSFMDIEHLYMAAYKASFHGANYVPFNCENKQCNHVFLSDDIEIEDMIKFKDEKAKAKFYDILNNTDTVSKEDACLYETKIVPISNTIAIGFREPSIYNTIFENSILDQKFVDKYTRLLTMMVYIDNIYLISGGQYVPVACKKDKNSIAKTAKYRIVTYSKIISTLSSDDYNNILAEIAKINELGDEVKYQLPEITCPKCGQTIQAAEQSATQLLFARHQLNLLSQEY